MITWGWSMYLIPTCIASVLLPFTSISLLSTTPSLRCFGLACTEIVYREKACSPYMVTCRVRSQYVILFFCRRVMYDHLSSRHVGLFWCEQLGLLGLVIAGAVLQVGDIELEVLELLLWALV